MNFHDKVQDCHIAIIQVLQKKYGTCNLGNKEFESIMMALTLTTAVVIIRGSDEHKYNCKNFYNILKEIVDNPSKYLDDL